MESLGLPSPLELLVSHGNVSGDKKLIMAGPESADMQHLVMRPNCWSDWQGLSDWRGGALSRLGSEQSD